MPIVIRSSKDGFRRCGVAHKKELVTWPDSQFTKKELELLKAEPKLSVTITREAEASTTKETFIENTGNCVSDTEGREQMAKKMDKGPGFEVASEILEAARKAVADKDTIKSGAPDIKAMEQILGRNVDKDVRDQAWEIIQAETSQDVPETREQA